MAFLVVTIISSLRVR